MALEPQPRKRDTRTHSVSTFNVRAKTRQVVSHHYDDEKSGKPLYLMIPGGVIALITLVLIALLAYRVWIEGTLSASRGWPLIVLLAPFYVGGVFLFSYGYELYDVWKALRLTALIVFITAAAVVIVAVLALVLFGMANQESGPSRRSRSSAPARGGGGMGWGMFPIFMGGLGMPGQTVTREVVREEPTQPATPPPQSIQCPYCGNSYVPAEAHFACPTCGAPTPQELLPLDNRTP
jgi:hypothetical protein